MKIFLIILAVFLTIAALDNPQGLIFPLWIIIYLNKERIISVFKLNQAPLWLAFISVGVFLGLAGEVFAIINNLDVPPEQKILLHPNALVDLSLSVFYYGMYITVWYHLLKKYSFNYLTIFVGAGLYGLLAEQGAVYFFALLSPLGFLMGLIIMSVYAWFPMSAYMLNRSRFIDRIKPKIKHYLLIPLGLFLFWAVFGNFIYNPVISLLSQ